VSETEEARDLLAPLEHALAYRFRNRAFLEHALHHSSYAHDHEGVESNERLEFLGDSVIGLVVAHALYEAKPEWNEGELTRALHALVEGRSLAALARTLDLGMVLKLGRTERSSGGEEKDSILADAMEAVIGAMYLDGGFDSVRSFVERVFGEALHAAAPPVARDPKTELQERAMASRGEFPTYRLTRDSAIEGDDQRFEVEVVLCGESLASGVGRTKRAAERTAAAVALESWVDDDPREV
jgi:ribonuclease-3